MFGCWWFLNRIGCVQSQRRRRQVESIWPPSRASKQRNRHDDAASAVARIHTKQHHCLSRSWLRAVVRFPMEKQIGWWKIYVILELKLILFFWPTSRERESPVLGLKWFVSVLCKQLQQLITTCVSFAQKFTLSPSPQTSNQMDWRTGGMGGREKREIQHTIRDMT